MNADHEAAVEAAKAEFLRIWREERHPTGRPVADITAAITTYLRRIRAAGFVVTRVPDKVAEINDRNWRHGFNKAIDATLANAVEVPE